MLRKLSNSGDHTVLIAHLKMFRLIRYSSGGIVVAKRNSQKIEKKIGLIPAKFHWKNAGENIKRSGLHSLIPHFMPVWIKLCQVELQLARVFVENKDGKHFGNTLRSKIFWKIAESFSSARSYTPINILWY